MAERPPPIKLKKSFPLAEAQRLAQEILPRLQQALLPEHSDEFIAIHLETEEYTLGETSLEATQRFQKKWPDFVPFVCRVDGGPVVKFHGFVPA